LSAGASCQPIASGTERLGLVSSSRPSWPTTTATPSCCASAAWTPGTARTRASVAAAMVPRIGEPSSAVVERDERTTASVSRYTLAEMSS
jgi:hypothetical protein